MSGKQSPLCLHFFHFLCVSVSIQKQSRNDSPSQEPSQQWFWHLCKRSIEWHGVYGRDGVLGSREWYTEKSPLSPVLVYSMRERWNYGLDMDLIVERDLNWWCQANSDLILALPLILIILPVHLLQVLDWVFHTVMISIYHHRSYLHLFGSVFKEWTQVVSRIPGCVGHRLEP